MGKGFGFPGSCRMRFAKCSHRKGTRLHLGQTSREEVPVTTGGCTSTQLTRGADEWDFVDLLS